MNQVATFTGMDKANEWLELNKELEIVDIKFQHSPASYYVYMVHYKIQEGQKVRKVSRY
jgi:hypothetical protein